jgi:C4-dicarboxylate-specific signal transduction histidine kinase
LLTISPITNQDGTLMHFLGISEDITERKRAEDEARRQRNELAQLGRVIIMGEMATSLAHELNQPLTVISGCAQVCLKKLRSERSKPEELLESMEQVNEQAERANQIIRRARSFIQREEQERGEIDVNEAIRNIADLLHSDAREHGAGIELELAAALPTVVADPFQIQQVILNLVHNGMEAMSEVRPALRHLTIHTSVSGDDAVEIAVCDQGQEMPTEVLDRVFDPFFTTKSTGLGMGLSICRSIIESHGGRLWATSDGEIGTVFRFTLPASDKGSRDDA